MTVIAWSGTQLAADSLECYGSCRSVRPVQKLRQRGSIVFACTGTGALFEPMIEWYMGGRKIDELPKADDDTKHTKLIVFENGRAWVYSPAIPYPAEVFAPDAWGCGADLAIGVMENGGSAERAVEIVIKREVYCGGPIQVIDLEALQKLEDAA